MYDTIIVGTGPAGLTAAIYGTRARLEMLILEQNFMSGGQVVNTYEVDNYPGLPGMNGADMSMKFREHAENLGAKFVQGKVEEVQQTEDGTYRVITASESYETKTVIYATGAHHRKLQVPGEEEFSGKGVSYCATCDGAFYRDKTVAVVGGGDVAVEDAIFLARICKKVYVIHRREELRAVKSLQESLLGLDNVDTVWNHVATAITGDEFVEGIVVEDVNTKEQQTLPVDGVFIAVGIIPDSDLVKDLAPLDQGGYISADETGETSTPGFFAAGDVRTKALRQIITAAADGANAIFSVEKYLMEH